MTTGVNTLRLNKIPKQNPGQEPNPIEDRLSAVLTTDRQKTFLRNRMAGMNKRQAAIQAGYSPATASLMAKRLTDKLACNRYFMEEAHRQGLTVEAIISELKRGVTKAMHPLRPDQPDNYNRRAFLDIAMRLFGAYAPTKIDMDIKKQEAKIIITPEILERLERYNRQRAELEQMGHIVSDPQEDKAPFG
jgi:phage terminase small subunit